MTLINESLKCAVYMTNFLCYFCLLRPGQSLSGLQPLHGCLFGTLILLEFFPPGGGGRDAGDLTMTLPGLDARAKPSVCFMVALAIEYFVGQTKRSIATKIIGCIARIAIDCCLESWWVGK